MFVLCAKVTGFFCVLCCLIYLYFQHTRLLYLLPPTLNNWNVFHILVAFWLYYFFNNQHHNLKSINFYLNRWVCTFSVSMVIHVIQSDQIESGSAPTINKGSIYIVNYIIKRRNYSTCLHALRSHQIIILLMNV